ncbi:hypothetical protein [Dyella mobilis]|uniref:Uncharacterized protein n=1 Tax=Dyella mobilis TaxID=1849582 RepID=A0ABS2KDX7_9GAMM|nr:hypothetical protein [Dyella mobilis]MBM7129381.1 hypothetical protein [Dyella mobilis]GLQ98676.1 hypothetical protein GCM10007863_30960 [Dyella mobilis]
MSWDLSIQRFTKPYADASEIPQDERCLPLGSREGVQRAISEVFVGTDWTEPTWGIYGSVDGSIEFNMGESDPNEGFALHVRASTKVLPMIIELCHRHDWQALDWSSGEFLEQSENPGASLEAWLKYRDQIVGGK